MDARETRVPSDGCGVGRWLDQRGECTLGLALVLRACLEERVGRCEPSAEVWERILVRVRQAGRDPALLVTL